MASHSKVCGEFVVSHNIPHSSCTDLNYGNITLKNDWQKSLLKHS